ncbi:flagellar filament capping protein FliD, partial [Pseudomonas viridiflava]|uniref:flagellar filament capping protein FliD n=1 Tax=Pseudomonas viridiflava TaxID=33069 RepID=UPI001F11C282
RTQIATSTTTSGLGSLAQLVMQTQQTDGTLSLDSTKFTAALSDKKMGSQIQALFTGEGGLLSRLDKAVKPYNDPAKGILPAKTTSLTAMQKQLPKTRRIWTVVSTPSRRT